MMQTAPCTSLPRCGASLAPVLRLRVASQPPAIRRRDILATCNIITSWHWLRGAGQPLCGCNLDMLRKPIAEELYNKFLAACRAETLRALPYEAFALPDPGDGQPCSERTKQANNRSACCSCFNFLTCFGGNGGLVSCLSDASSDGRK